MERGEGVLKWGTKVFETGPGEAKVVMVQYRILNSIISLVLSDKGVHTALSAATIHKYKFFNPIFALPATF